MSWRKKKAYEKKMRTKIGKKRMQLAKIGPPVYTARPFESQRMFSTGGQGGVVEGEETSATLTVCRPEEGSK